MARLACAGRALGAAQRGFDLSVEHAKVRKQFGQLIGQFQAVQHKLANSLINLDGARLALDAAAEARDRGNPDWRVFASAALAFAGPALREVTIQTHRALGAIGYAEEHEAPRHFRRVHADLARFGGVSRARAELADFIWSAGLRDSAWPPSPPTTWVKPPTPSARRSATGLRRTGRRKSAPRICASRSRSAAGTSSSPS